MDTFVSSNQGSCASMLGEESEIASIALFNFILGNTDEEKIDAFNKILAEVGLSVKLVKDGETFIWCGDAQENAMLAEEVFDEVSNCISYEKLIEYMSQDRISPLLREYDVTIRNIKRRAETIRWISEIQA